MGWLGWNAALEETDDNVEEARAWLLKRGKAIAAKKAGREANEGLVAYATSDSGSVGLLLEVNCETDFAAKNEAFHAYMADIAQAGVDAVAGGGQDLVSATPVDLDLGLLGDLEDGLAALTLKIGEPLKVSRGVLLSGPGLAGYVHRASTGGSVNNVTLGKMGALVSVQDLSADELDAGLPTQLAQQIVGTQPASKDDLLLQPFLFNPDLSVSQVLNDRTLTYTQLSVGI